MYIYIWFYNINNVTRALKYFECHKQCLLYVTTSFDRSHHRVNILKLLTFYWFLNYYIISWENNILKCTSSLAFSVCEILYQKILDTLFLKPCSLCRISKIQLAFSVVKFGHTILSPFNWEGEGTSV